MKKIFLFLFLFLLLYFEPLYFLGLKLSHLWKIIFIFICIILIFKKNYFFPKFVKIYLAYGISLTVSPFFLEHNFDILIQSSKYLFFPFLFTFLLINRNYNWIDKQMLSAFVIVSFLPFYFNLLPQLGVSYELETMGFEINDALSGIFQQPHAASLALSLSVTTLILGLSKENKLPKKILFSALIVMGMFFLLKTYVRLGLILVLISLCLIFLYKTRVGVKFKLISFFVFIGIIFGTYLTNNNSTQIETYKARLLGQSGYSVDNEVDSNSISSGRLNIWKSTLYNWLKDDEVSIIILGLSEPELIKRNKKDIGQAVFSHNEFLNALAVGGLISISLFFGFFFLWWKKIKILKKKIFDIQYYKYALVIFVNIFIFNVLQGGPISLISGLFILFSLVPLYELKNNKLI